MTREEVKERCKELAAALAGALEAARAEFKLLWRVEVSDCGDWVSVVSDDFTITLSAARAWGRIRVEAHACESLRKYIVDSPDASVDAGRDRVQASRHIINRIARPMAASVEKARERASRDRDAERRREEAAAAVVEAGAGLLTISRIVRSQNRRDAVFVTSSGQEEGGVTFEGEIGAERAQLKIGNATTEEAVILARVVSALVERRKRGPEEETGDGCDWLALVA